LTNGVLSHSDLPITRELVGLYSSTPHDRRPLSLFFFRGSPDVFVKAPQRTDLSPSGSNVTVVLTQNPFPSPEVRSPPYADPPPEIHGPRDLSFFFSLTRVPPFRFPPPYTGVFSPPLRSYTESAPSALFPPRFVFSAGLGGRAYLGPGSFPLVGPWNVHYTRGSSYSHASNVVIWALLTRNNVRTWRWLLR